MTLLTVTYWYLLADLISHLKNLLIYFYFFYNFKWIFNILCLIYQNIISAFVTAGEMHSCQCKYIYATSDEASVFPLLSNIHLVDTDLICLETAQMSYYSK